MISPAPPSLLSTIQSSARTTPGFMQVGLVVGLLLAVLFAAEVAIAASVDHQAADVIGNEAAPAIIAAQGLWAKLVEGDANAANYLIGKGDLNIKAGEAAEVDFTQANALLITAIEHSTPGGRDLVVLKALQDNLGTYRELWRQAKTLHLHGDDAGTTFVYRDATHVMEDQLLAEAGELDTVKSAQLAQAYAGQKSQASFAIFRIGFVALLLLVDLIVLQVFIRRRTRRTFSLPLLAATALVILATLFSVSTLIRSGQDLQFATEKAFPSIHTLWRIRAYAYDANTEGSRFLSDTELANRYERGLIDDLNLIARKGNATPQQRNDILFKGEDYVGLVAQAKAGTVSFQGYVADVLNNSAIPGERELAIGVLSDLGTYVTIDAAVRDLEGAGKHAEALALRTGYGENQSNWAFQRLDQALTTTISRDQAPFDQAIGDSLNSTASFDAFAAIIGLLLIVALWFGLQPRLREYDV